MSGAGVLAVALLLTAAWADLTVTRRHPVDSFKGSCQSGGCIGASMGTALALSSDGCTCACAPHLPAFREDLHICVDDLHDCPLIPFVSGTTYQKIPFVFLPLKGQIIYPSAELVFAGVESPVCVVSSAKFLSTSGWGELRNGTDSEPPFRLFRDEGRTFLQWLGDGDLRQYLEGRLILVHLMCKDMVDERNADNNIFTSCVSFRVAGSPSEDNPKAGVKEVIFSVDSQNTSQNVGSSYIIVAVSSVLLGVIYIVSVLLYLQGKKKRTKYHDNNNGLLTVAEEGIVKNNPLLKHCHENMAYLSDTPSESDSEDCAELGSTAEDTRTHKVQTTSALIHPLSNAREKKSNENCYQLQESSSIERLPEENVSIIETLDYREERPETVRAISCTNGRRKLYFNPAYFEPELLLAPPPAAIEFLTKIREVISIAKAKMEAKKFLPSLMGIPEENDYALHKSSSIAGTESTIILRTDSNRNKYSKSEHQKHDRSMEKGCHLCYRNTEQKQTSIQKWLENVPTAKVEDETSRTSSSNGKKASNKKNKSHLNVKAHGRNNRKQNENVQNNNAYENNEITCQNYKLMTDYYNSSVIFGSSYVNKDEGSTNASKSFTTSEKIMEITDGDQTELVSHNLISSNSLNKHEESSYLNVSKSDTNSQNSTLKSDNLFKNNKEIKPEVENKGETVVKNESDSVNFGDKFSEKKHLNNEELNHKLDKNIKPKQDIFDVNINNNKNANGHKDEHDYETIMLGRKHEDSQSLPDFINRPCGYSLVSEVYVNDGYDYISESSHSNLSSLNSNESADKVEYDRNSLGQLTIKVHDSPPLAYSNDSDSFEPDTLDRKPNKLKINQEICINIEKNQDIYADSLERPLHISLKSSGTFKNGTHWNNIEIQNGDTKYPLNRAFGSLREIFEAKTKYNQCAHNKSIKSCSPVGSTKSLTSDAETFIMKSWRRGKPKLLRPEAKQARRQRDPSPPNQTVLSPPFIPQSEENLITNLSKKDAGPPLPPRLVKPPLPPKNGATRSNIHESYIHNQILSSHSHEATKKIHGIVDVASETFEYEPLNSQELMNNCLKAQNDTEFNSEKESSILNEKNNKNKRSTIRHVQNRTEDSGYLSTDSNGSDTIFKKEDSISETDDSFFDGASESGAESIATDSFFFGKGAKSYKTNSLSNSPTELDCLSDN